MLVPSIIAHIGLGTKLGWGGGGVLSMCLLTAQYSNLQDQFLNIAR